MGRRQDVFELRGGAAVVVGAVDMWAVFFPSTYPQLVRRNLNKPLGKLDRIYRKKLALSLWGYSNTTRGYGGREPEHHNIDRQPEL